MKEIGVPEVLRGRRLWIAGAVGLVLIVLVLLAVFREDRDNGGRWAVVEKGDFVIDLLESGEIRAVNSYDIKVPMIWGDLQIIEMADEGVVVKAGDFLVQFDETNFVKDMATRKESLETAEAELKALDTQQEQRRNEMESNLKASEYSREVAELNRTMMKFESPLKQRQAEIEYQRQMLTLDENETRLRNQKVIDTAERWRVLQRVDHNKERLEEIKQQIASLTLSAPIGGMVVYNEIGGRGVERKKVAIGDKPWPSQAIISIPDPSYMQMIARVNEVDASKIAVGDKVDIRLDAFEHARYTGTVKRVASLADKRDSESQIKDFEVSIDIAEPDSVLKPGMTAQGRVIIGRRADAVFVPIGAIFEQSDGKTVVFKRKNPEKPVPVVVGKRNSRYIMVAEGVTPGEEVSLQPPAEGTYYALGRAREMARRAQEIRKLQATPDSLLTPEKAPNAPGAPEKAEADRADRPRGDAARPAGEARVRREGASAAVSGERPAGGERRRAE